MDYPIPASVTPMPEPLVYDEKATIVINNSRWVSQPELSLRTAGEISRVWRDAPIAEARNASYAKSVNSVREYLIENYDELEEHADEIAKLLDIDLSKTVEVTFQVEISATISLPIGKDFRDLSEYDFDVELTCNDSDYEVEGYDATIERMTED